ncbi:hypothetical protein EJB05_24563 [Eragrostis curvula]|uniref:Uncharacterized protein n=1 Tax=Eragrostis curvula TaxID=38414 RepID=A0A5J9VA23_9POAL|nr:hypothetical protein EJB05_24563 [Eragrostis curvula]
MYIKDDLRSSPAATAASVDGSTRLLQRLAKRPLGRSTEMLNPQFSAWSSISICWHRHSELQKAFSPLQFEVKNKQISSPSSLLSQRQHRLKKSAVGAGGSSASTSQLPPASSKPKYTRFRTLRPLPSFLSMCVMTQV